MADFKVSYRNLNNYLRKKDDTKDEKQEIEEEMVE